MKANRRMRWVFSAGLFALVLTVVALVAPPTALPQSGYAGQVLLGAADDGRLVQLRADQVLEVRLEANYAAGYGWYVQHMDAAVLQQVGDPEIEALTPRLGAPSTVILRFAPQAAGQSPLVLAYRRPWEEVAPLQTYSLEVTAAGAYAGVETFGAAEASRAEVLPGTAGATVGAALPTALNWCTNVGCTPIRDQGACGSCWAFSTAGALEQNIRIVDGIVKDLSEQYLVSCNTEGWGCGGGWWAHDYYQSKVPPGEPGPGAVYEAAFPYVAKDIACNPPHAHYEKIAGWAYVGAVNGVPPVAALKQAIHDYGPVAAAVCTGSRFNAYTGGVLTTGDVCDGAVNHGIMLVGWDDSLGPSGAWILRNSWGSDWGEGGYMKIAYGVSNVGYGASYVVRGDVRQDPPAAPSALDAVSVSTSRIDLSWADNSSNETGFYVQRSPNGIDGWSLVNTVGANTEAWSNTGLPLSTLYYYRVQAYNDDGPSPYSNVDYARTWPDASAIDERLYVPLVGQNWR